MLQKVHEGQEEQEKIGKSWSEVSSILDEEGISSKLIQD